MVRIIQTENYEAMSLRAADMLAGQIFLKHDSLLGLATGSTPVGLYRELIKKYESGALSFAALRTVNLDEYRGLAPTHEQSYRYFMQRNLFDHVDIKRSNTHVPDGLAADPQAECRRYDELCRALGRTDVQLLGLGRNGHIGFNEPGDCFIKETHVVDLTESTIQANARFFASADEVPRQALTMGMGVIMDAKRILVVASGADKADAVYAAFCGPITPKVPASILQLHREVALVADKAALSKLTAAGVSVGD